MNGNISCCFSQRLSQLSNNLGLCQRAVWFLSEDSILLIASDWFQFHEPVQSSLETVPAFSTYNMMQHKISFVWSEEFFFFFFVFCLTPVSVSRCLCSWEHSMIINVFSSSPSHLARRALWQSPPALPLPMSLQWPPGWGFQLQKNGKHYSLSHNTFLSGRIFIINVHRV